ncbi:MAG: hypothetical protein LBI60_05770 [Bacteroidales bacterium]|jgi:hypothetical protein|nr:hypothetical protein [Bacteroidales bacterium]
MELTATITKRGLVALWEKGGGCQNTGEATIIANREGGKPTAIYFRRGGHLSNREHALIPVHYGYHVIQAWEQRGDFEIQVSVVTETNVEKESVTIALINEFKQGEWDIEPDSDLMYAIQAAKDKINDYHCRDVYYAVIKEKKDANLINI